MTQKPKWTPDFDQTLKIIATLAAVAVPIVVAILGAVINSSIGKAQVQADYVGLVVEILARPIPEDEDAQKSDQALREWAVDVLAQNSPVTLEEDLQALLKQGAVNLQPITFNAGALLNPGSFTLPTALPEGCTVTNDEVVSVYGSALSFPLPAGELAPGTRPATLRQSSGAITYYRTEEGWVRSSDVTASGCGFAFRFPVPTTTTAP